MGIERAKLLKLKFEFYFLLCDNLVPKVTAGLCDMISSPAAQIGIAYSRGNHSDGVLTVRAAIPREVDYIITTKTNICVY